ncbi:MAG: CoA transferase [Chloroflexi bacterium]|nr:CoA transferase [Chloroflexota bacterium]
MELVEREQASALDGITALDLTEGAAGAQATMHLCDNGARVIRIEHPGTELKRLGPGFAVWNRGKRSAFLDIAADTPAFDKLVASADVLVETFAPSSPYQRIVDYDRLKAINPRLVHCSITAYGREGPLKDEPPIDELVMARMGILSSQPSFRPGPVHVAHPVPSVGAGILAAQGVVASLFWRERTGKGRKVDTSLMAGALLYAPRVAAEKQTNRLFQSTPAGGGPFYSVFECGDGEYIQIGCIHGGFVDLAAAVMGIADIMSNPRYGDGRIPASEEARRELFDIVAGIIKSKPYAEWAEIFEAADVPFARACATAEAFDNPQVRANEMIVELDDPELGRVKQMGLPIKLSGTPGRIGISRALPGHHTRDILSSLPNSVPPQGDGQSEILEPPLKGVRVLEMTNVIAGPTGGKLLADLGAEVIKLESPFGDISRPAGSAYFLYLNSNKRSVSVDTKTREGKEIAQRLAAQADIMFANMRPGAAERMGLGDDVLEKINPGLIQAHVTAFGWTGPFSHRPGVDPLAQAWMGLQRAQGGRENPPVFLAALAPTDFTAGALGALGALMALYVRERTGRTQRVDTNLLNAGALLRGDDFMRYEGKPPARLADKGQHGLCALHRLYETQAGWLYLVAESENHWLALCKALRRDELASDERFSSLEARARNDYALACELSETFRQRGVEDWLLRLKQQGVPCAPSVERHNAAFFLDSHIVASDMIARHEHPTLGWMLLGRSGVRFRDTEDAPTRRTPLLGEHNREALQEIGYASEQIDDFYASGVLKTETP